MYYDSLRKAYVDKESGEVVFQEEEEAIQPTIVQPPTPIRNEQKALREEDSARARNFERLFELARQEVQQNNYNQLESQIIEMHRLGDDPELATSTVAAPQEHEPGFSDWSLARTLQALEFEIPRDGYAEDFGQKEYRASRSCRRQLLTVSFFICLVQVSITIEDSGFVVYVFVKF